MKHHQNKDLQKNFSINMAAKLQSVLLLFIKCTKSPNNISIIDMMETKTILRTISEQLSKT